jgi:hypothetical protein
MSCGTVVGFEPIAEGFNGAPTQSEGNSEIQQMIWQGHDSWVLAVM